jgi:MFS family permease
VIAAAGAATVLSFAILSEYFPKEMSGRANAALNLLHVGGAFVLQSATGLIIELWPATNGSYPVDAHQTAMAASIVVQLAALAWFALAPRSQPVSAMHGLVMRAAISRRPQSRSALTRYATGPWGEQSRTGELTTGWRFAAIASAALCGALATALASTIGHANLAAHIVEVDWPTVTADSATLRDAMAATTAEAASLPGWRCCGKFQPNEPRTVAACI